MNTEKSKIYVTALIYIKEGKQALFEEYRSKARSILERHNARIEKIIKPTMLAKGNIKLPNEIHFAEFDSKASMDAVNNDVDYKKIIDELRNPSVEKLIVIPSKLSDFKFDREIGDKSKTYGIAFLNYNSGKKYEKLFGDYHAQACEIMPEFGTHFERFLLPTGIKGDFKQPDEIHRFYFDSMEGLQQMGSDRRMQKIIPLRDESLSDLNFIIGEAI
ncbi:MAG: hypothetical protein DWQ05_18335 [Calditrichaeota bacterium]|nr:MAG: hypothetical protein DWQ05_18335 [Calditrichota bacterium]